jgi:hypothetical protein
MREEDVERQEAREQRREARDMMPEGRGEGQEARGKREEEEASMEDLREGGSESLMVSQVTVLVLKLAVLYFVNNSHWRQERTKETRGESRVE